MAFVILDDLDMSAEEADWHEKSRIMFTLVAFRPFESAADAQCQMNAISKMLVGMVDVLVADTASRDEVMFASLNAAFFLKAGGHFMISGQASYMDLTSKDEDMFGFLGKARQPELKPIERVMLKQLGDYAMAVGGFRVEA
ncbi:hypothetical protein V2J09_006779 [Rumex salicifolius]